MKKPNCFDVRHYALPMVTAPLQGPGCCLVPTLTRHTRGPAPPALKLLRRVGPQRADDFGLGALVEMTDVRSHYDVRTPAPGEPPGRGVSRARPPPPATRASARTRPGPSPLIRRRSLARAPTDRRRRSRTPQSGRVPSERPGHTGRTAPRPAWPPPAARRGAHFWGSAGATGGEPSWSFSVSWPSGLRTARTSALASAQLVSVRMSSQMDEKSASSTIR